MLLVNTDEESMRKISVPQSTVQVFLEQIHWDIYKTKLFQMTYTTKYNMHEDEQRVENLSLQHIASWTGQDENLLISFLYICVKDISQNKYVALKLISHVTLLADSFLCKWITSFIIQISGLVNTLC